MIRAEQLMPASDSWCRTRFFGLHSLPPRREEITEFVRQLDYWNATAPRNLPPDVPQQDEQWRRGFYLQTMLQLMRPVLRQSAINPDMLLLCANKAVEACGVCSNPLSSFANDTTNGP